MNAVNGLVLLCLWMLLWTAPAGAIMPPPGAITPPAGEKEVEGRGEGFRPEAKEEAQEGEKKEDECPATFGPIITDTAIPIDKGKFAFNPPSA